MKTFVNTGHFNIQIRKCLKNYVYLDTNICTLTAVNFLRIPRNYTLWAIPVNPSAPGKWNFKFSLMENRFKLSPPGWAVLSKNFASNLSEKKYFDCPLAVIYYNEGVLFSTFIIHYSILSCLLFIILLSLPVYTRVISNFNGNRCRQNQIFLILNSSQIKLVSVWNFYFFSSHKPVYNGRYSFTGK